MAGHHPTDWDFLLVEQLAQVEGHRATLNDLADGLAEGDPERFAYIHAQFRAVLPGLVADEWVTQSGPIIALALKGRVAASLPKQHDDTAGARGG